MRKRKKKFLRDLQALFQKLNIRVFLMIAVILILCGGLVYRLFGLQIVRGDEFLTSFQLRLKREVTIPGTRGNIYDRNGQLLAYNELAYSVVIRDVFDNGSKKNDAINDVILRTIDIIESHGGEVTDDFGISCEYGNFLFRRSGSQHLRFLADVYGYLSIDELTYAERTSTPDEVMAYLAKQYGIKPEELESPLKQLQLTTVRWLLSLNSYQKYVASPIAFDVDEETVVAIMENSGTLQGVTIEEDTVRRYPDSVYFSQILGYTGRVSTEELETLTQEDPTYEATDIVGKAGIEASFESELHGKKGSRTIYVDNLGRVLGVEGEVSPQTGNDVYLSIDKDLTMAAYDILEKKLSEILLAKIRPVREMEITENTSSSSLIIPIYEVYFSVFNNNVVSLSHMAGNEAGETERAVHAAMEEYRQQVLNELGAEIRERQTPYEELPKEYKIYETGYIDTLEERGILVRDLEDAQDPVYIDWHKNETISMTQFLTHAIEEGWVDVTALGMPGAYSDTAQVLEAVIRDQEAFLLTDKEFEKKVLHYMILQDLVSGNQVCRILMEQQLVTVPTAEREQFESGVIGSYEFMRNRIRELDLTPAQLNLDPYSGSMVITDPGSGQVLALVSYPSFDNNRLSGSVDSDYYDQLREDLSGPLYNYATLQETAPGSTFKMVSATAGLQEGVITTDEMIDCTGIFHKLGDPAPKCWVYPAAHRNLTVQGAIHNSCNVFFYELGYRLGQEQTAPAEESADTETTTQETEEEAATAETESEGRTQKSAVYNSDTGVAILGKYARMYGLGDKTGIEIEEAAPQISTEDAVRSAIGQGNHNFTTVSLARYVATVANRGECLNLTLLDHVSDSSGIVLREAEPSVKNVIEMDPVCWTALQEGMREVVKDKLYFMNFPVEVAGKTGTAQQTNTRPNHALFVCFAPYDAPEVAVATRIANGYTSDYAANITKSVLEYYFGLATKEELLASETIFDTGRTAQTD